MKITGKEISGWIMLICAGWIFISLTHKPVTIFMAGDSTMADKPFYKDVKDSVEGLIYREAFLERGWGQLLPEYTDKNTLVKNYAQNGRSTRTFREEGWWDSISSQVQPGDLVIIQFGHNDESTNKPNRYTTPEQFRENYLFFIQDLRSKGANPVLCTPVCRRRFNESGELLYSHGKYPDIIRKLAKETHAPLIDMEKLTFKWMSDAGADPSRKFYHKLKPGISKLFPNGLDDNTHYNENGARTVAGFFCKEARKQHIKLITDHLKNPTFQK